MKRAVRERLHTLGVDKALGPASRPCPIARPRIFASPEKGRGTSLRMVGVVWTIRYWEAGVKDTRPGRSR